MFTEVFCVGSFSAKGVISQVTPFIQDVLIEINQSSI